MLDEMPDGVRAGPATRAGTPDRQRLILQATLECAVAQGVDAVSIDAVRARCGASVGSIYHHFGSKEGLVAALFLEVFHAQSRAIQRALDDAQGPEDGVRALVTGYLDWVVADPDRARFLFQARSHVAAGPRREDLIAAAQSRNRALLRWFEPHQSRGDVRELPCDILPSLVMGPVQSYCRAWLGNHGGMPDPRTFRAVLADAAWRSVRR